MGAPPNICPCFEGKIQFQIGSDVDVILFLLCMSVDTVDRLSKNRQEEENTITFRLKCIVIA